MRTFFLLLATVPLWASGQGTPKSLLWRITKEGKVHGHLYGTVHSPDERAYQLGDSVLPALHRSDVVAGELDLSTEGQGPLMQAMMTMARLPEGRRLEDLFSRKEWKIVEPALRERAGPMAEMLMRMKPIFGASIIWSGPSVRGSRPEMLDAFLLNTAMANGKRTIGLETPVEQMAALDAMPLEDQADLLLESVKDQAKAEQGFEDLMDAYAAQDLDALVEASKSAGALSPVFLDAFLDKRNGRMVLRMDSLMRGEGTYFFAVGAAHLPGMAGVIEGLRNRSWTVEPIFSAHTVPIPMDAEEPPPTQEELERHQQGTLVEEPPPPPFPPPMLLGHGIRFQNDTLGFAVDMPTRPEQVPGMRIAGITGRTTAFSARDEEDHLFLVVTIDIEDATLPDDSVVVRFERAMGRSAAVEFKGRVPEAPCPAWEFGMSAPPDDLGVWRVYRPVQGRLHALSCFRIEGAAEAATVAAFFASFTPIDR